MTVLLYEYFQLEERAARHLRVWKAWHLIIFALAAIFGVLNYLLLLNTMQLVDNHCVLFPRELAFKTIDVPTLAASTNTQSLYNDTAQDAREESSDSSSNLKLDIVTDDEKRTVLDTTRSLFGTDSDCDYAEYIPIISFIMAIIWSTMFTMCPGGGHSRSGLQQPWTILPPALIFSIIMVGLTGHSFTTTNKGIDGFCAAFYNITNSTTCSSVEPHLESSWSGPWGFGSRTAATRAASAGTWASWACAFALFMARCLVAPDFDMKRTGAYLHDPEKKLTPYLKKSRRQKPAKSPTTRDSTSVRSEPTGTTELVTVSIEQGQDTAPTSLQTTPAKITFKENIEMVYAPSNGSIL
ncbi:uncharacterized protein LOC126970260 [Leptidea sinapis]|uniref:uncharacterized protein LOC126970260 n=1 Tax=Leptidea sinapis TaxID=189913 RepID=UPI00212E2C45|nr:uncharacterized protein LOC126970260 [Leptidea sinapis]